MHRLVLALLLASTAPAPAAGQEGPPPAPAAAAQAPAAQVPAAQDPTLAPQAAAAPAPTPPQAAAALPPGALAPAWPPRRFALSLSPIHLLIGMVELTGEVRLGERTSLALIGGLGRMSVVYAPCASMVCTASVNVHEVGAQGRWYLTSFDRGLHAGVEVTYLKLDATDATVEAKATAEGTTVGPFVGWKFVGQTGFTVDLQGGLQVLVVPASNQGTTSTGRKTRVLPLLNANLGWSF